jgi:hypothetical protein
MNEDRMNEYLDDIDSEMVYLNNGEGLEEWIEDRVGKTAAYIRGLFPNIDISDHDKEWIEETFYDDPYMDVEDCGQFFIDHFDLYSPDWRETTIPTKWELSNN